MAAPEFVTLADSAAVARAAAKRFTTLARQAIAARGRFCVALAGGSTPSDLYRLLAGEPYRTQVDWTRVRLFFGDERCVPPADPASNLYLVQQTLLAGPARSHPEPGAVFPGNGRHGGNGVEAGPESARIFPIPTELPPAQAAAAYAVRLWSAFGIHGTVSPIFDLILLGMGPDGHTASLFPGAAALTEAHLPVVDTPAPEGVTPSVPRVTLTLPVLNAAQQVLFLVTGSNKRTALAAVMAGEPLPAGLVRPERGSVIWLIDRAASPS